MVFPIYIIMIIGQNHGYLFNFLLNFQISSSQMLSQCYEHLFSNLMPNQAHLDSLLQLWLILNSEGNSDGSSRMTFDPNRTPKIQLSQSAMSNILSMVILTPSLPVCTWVLVFRALTLLANQKVPSADGGIEQSMAIVMFADRNLVRMVQKFLSGVSDVGPVACAAQYSMVSLTIPLLFLYLYFLLINTPTYQLYTTFIVYFIKLSDKV